MSITSIVGIHCSVPGLHMSESADVKRQRCSRNLAFNSAGLPQICCTEHNYQTVNIYKYLLSWKMTSKKEKKPKRPNRILHQTHPASHQGPHTPLQEHPCSSSA